MFDVFILATGLAWIVSCLWALLTAAVEPKASAADRAFGRQSSLPNDTLVVKAEQMGSADTEETVIPLVDLEHA